MLHCTKLGRCPLSGHAREDDVDRKTSKVRKSAQTWGGTMGLQRIVALAVILATAPCLSTVAAAADIKAQVSGALKVAFPDIVAAYEKQSGNKVIVTYGPGGAIAKGIAQ